MPAGATGEDALLAAALLIADVARKHSGDRAAFLADLAAARGVPVVATQKSNVRMRWAVLMVSTLPATVYASVLFEPSW